MAWVIYIFVILPAWVLVSPILALNWLLCRLEAKRCPKCGEDWWTTLVGEWDGEMWKCVSCGHCWETPYTCGKKQ